MCEVISLDIHAFWRDVLSQNRIALPSYFCEDAVIRWHCSNEQFTVMEYIQANCDYPNDWDGEIERLEYLGTTIVLVGRVFPVDQSSSFHVVSFIELKDDAICEMNEYWSDDGEAPAWRKEMNIGKPIR